MKKVFKALFAVALAVSLIGGVMACSSSSTPTTTSNSTATPNTTSASGALQQETVTIGVDAPLTGGAAAFGLSQDYGVTLAAQDFNAAGGLTVGNIHYTFNVKALDDQYDTADTVNNIRQLVYSDGVKYLFTFQTEGTLALGPELSSDKVINFTVVNDDGVIAQPANSYTYRTYVLPEMQIDPMYQWISQNYPSAKSLALLTTNNTNGVLLAAQLKAACAKYGITYQDQTFYDSGTTDFTSFVTKILSDNPDIISTLGAPPGDAALIVKTARDMGYKGLFTEGNIDAADMVPIAGAANMEGLIDADLYLQAPIASPTILGLPARSTAEWGASYGDEWDFYSEAWVLFQAIKKADSIDTTAVKAVLDNDSNVYDYAAITGGTATFGSPEALADIGPDGTHQIDNAWTICVVHNGVDTEAYLYNPPH
jgi:branched-chain amino acid transport system substrate-binding protein